MMASSRPSDPPPEHPPLPAPLPEPAGGLSRPSGFAIGFDWVLAAGVLVLAFFVGSFSVRNSDFWMHLATGRLIAAGEYSFGTDPFSFAAGDQRWVNHEWLYDWGLYQLYKAGGGPAAVVAKCLTLVLAAGLLMLTRRPGLSAFPFAACTGLALVAAASRMSLQPQVASVLLLAGFLFALIRMPKPAGSWAFPAAVGGLFLVWANVDQWFFLGPVFLALYAAGQFVRRDPDADPGTVLKALGVGVVACCLNPHHIHVWEVPAELAGGRLEKVFEADSEFAPLFRGGFDKAGWDFDNNPANPLALIGLLVLSAAGFAANARHLSVGLALIWASAAALGWWHLRAVPFFAFVAAPVAALNMAQAAARLAARPIPEGTGQALATAQLTGRFLVGLGGLFLIAVSYAGWLHPFNNQRRWAWDVEPVVSSQRAAEQIHAWRQAGALPKDARVLNLQPDMAYYIAWFAPGQQTFFDYRLGLLAPRAQEYADVRRQLAIRSDAEARQDQFNFPAFLRDNQIVYAVTAHPHRARNQYALAYLWQGGEASDWELWQVTGRAVILGWRRQTAVPPAAVAALRFDPRQAAFVNPAPVPEPESLHPPIRQGDVWDRYVAAPPVSPAEGEEVLVLDRYRESRMGLLIARHRFLLESPGRFLLRLYLPLPQDKTGGRRYYGLTFPLQEFLRYAAQFLPVEYPAEISAVSLLAVRAGRRAVVASPDHPDGYYFLAKAYQDHGFLSFPDIRTVVTSANFARCLARLPVDPTRRVVTIDIREACVGLFQAHLQATPPRVDLALECRRLEATYLRQFIADMDAVVGQIADDAERLREERDLTSKRKILEQIQTEIDGAELNVKRSSDAFVNSVANISSPLERAAVARRYGLVRDAIEELEKAHQGFVKRLENEADRAKMTVADQAMYVAVHAELIELLLFSGRAEDAVALLDALDTDENLTVMNGPAVRDQYYRTRQLAARRLIPERPPQSPYDGDPAAQVRSLRQVVSLAVGQYDAAVRAQTADAVAARDNLDQFVRQVYPAGAPVLKELADVDFRPQMTGLSMLQLGLLKAPVHPGVGALAQTALVLRFQAILNVQQYANLVRGRIDAHAGLALTYLEMGKVKEAVHHFTQAVEGPEPIAPMPSQRIARSYLKSIAQAAGPAK